MKKQFKQLLGFLPAVGMLILIIDSRTALRGAAEGVDLCIRTVVPSLLPFFILSSILTNGFNGKELRLLSPLGRICGIPPGHEPLLMLGLLGGYPIGAKGVYHAWSSGTLNKRAAVRMLGFCSNAGPSFIFGMAASMFNSKMTGWILWLIQICSAILTGICLPRKQVDHQRITITRETARNDVITASMKSLCSVCGWVILMRVVISFLQHWFLWLLPKTVAVAVSGLLELANGCCDLYNIPSEAVRFILCSGMLSFGGVCVLLQTVSVTKELGIGWYIPGKMSQCVLSIAFACVLTPIMFCEETGNTFPFLLAFFALVLIFTLLMRTCRKRSSFFCFVRV